MKRTLIYFLSAVALMSCGKVENKDNTATTPENAKYKIVVQFADSTLDGNPAYLTNYDTGDTISI
ncbi:MAG: hypothetical protein IK092_05870, partial [Muribaculaceae bacterium]|nr:hypothetical protein [Muribaculaceae bacterium]